MMAFVCAFVRYGRSCNCSLDLPLNGWRRFVSSPPDSSQTPHGERQMRDGRDADIATFRKKPRNPVGDPMPAADPVFFSSRSLHGERHREKKKNYQATRCKANALSL